MMTKSVEDVTSTSVSFESVPMHAIARFSLEFQEVK